MGAGEGGGVGAALESGGVAAKPSGGCGERAPRAVFTHTLTGSGEPVGRWGWRYDGTAPCTRKQEHDFHRHFHSHSGEWDDYESELPGQWIVPKCACQARLRPVPAPSGLAEGEAVQEVR